MSQNFIQNKLGKIIKRCYESVELTDYDIKQLIINLTECVKDMNNPDKDASTISMQIKQYEAFSNQSALKQYVDNQIIALKNILIEKIVDVSEEIEKMHDIFTQSLEKISNQINQKVEKSINQQSQKLKNLEDKFDKQTSVLKQTIQVQNIKFSDILNVLEKGGSVKQINQNKMEMEFPMNKSAEIIEAKNWVDPESKSFKSNSLIFENNIIVNKCLSDIYGTKVLNGQCSFTVKFTKLNKGLVALGIADSRYKSQVGIMNVENIVYYYNNGNCKVGLENINGGSGFKVGQKVKVCIDLNAGTVQWKANGKVRHSIQYDRLKVSTIKYVPFIFLWNQDCSLAIQSDQ